MKLLFDQNLSFKLCQTVADLFPESMHVRALGLSEVGDREIWDYARANDFAIVSQDADFAEVAALLGSPPKVIWCASEINRRKLSRSCYDDTPAPSLPSGPIRTSRVLRSIET